MMRKISLLLICSFLLLSFKSEERELDILYSLFPEIVSYAYHDIRLNKEPLPPPPEMDSIEEKDYRNKWEERRLKLLSDTTRAIILIPDTTFYHKYDQEEYEKQFKKHFDNKNLKIKQVELNKTIHLELNKLKTNNKRVRFEYVSKYPDEKKNKYRWNAERKFDGILRVSRIRFDQTQNFGYFILSYYRSPLDGWGSIIFIKKVDNKWIIDGSADGWIS